MSRRTGRRWPAAANDAAMGSRFGAGKKMARNEAGQMGFIKGVSRMYSPAGEEDVKGMSRNREAVSTDRAARDA